MCKIFSSYAFISRVLSYDKLSLGTKYRIRASIHMPNKSDKFSLRMFGLSSVEPGCPPFLYSFIPNSLGNYDSKSLLEKFVELYLELQTIYYK